MTQMARWVSESGVSTLPWCPSFLLAAVSKDIQVSGSGLPTDQDPAAFPGGMFKKHRHWWLPRVEICGVTGFCLVSTNDEKPAVCCARD